MQRRKIESIIGDKFIKSNVEEGKTFEDICFVV